MLKNLQSAFGLYAGIGVLILAGVLVNQGWLGTDVLDDIRGLVTLGVGVGGFALGKRAATGGGAS